MKQTVAYALGIAMETVLKNHIVRLKNEIRKHINGGAIGVKAAGEIAPCSCVGGTGSSLKRQIKYYEILTCTCGTY